MNKRLLKHLCLNSTLGFSQYFFKTKEASTFILNPHHVVIADTLQRVLTGEITRLIINVPPGYTKTEMVVNLFMAQGLAINPKAKFIHATYSADLALENSQKTRDIVMSEEYKELFDVEIRLDSKAKKKWYTTEGGGVYAAAAGGAITGFRAGRFGGGFQGAFIFDDPLKPDDAYRKVTRGKINNRFMNTFKSRLAIEATTPMILIMQRLHEDDPSGFLLRGGTGEKWHHLLMPSPVPEGPIESWYPTKYTHGIPIKHNLLPGPLWALKHDADKLEQMSIADPYTFKSQYAQAPAYEQGGIFKTEWWQLWTVLPKDLAYARVYCDTAQKTGEHNDYTVFQLWAYSPSKGIFLIEQFRGKLEAPELEQALVDFWAQSKARCKQHSIRVTVVKVEDKSSGTGLIQSIKRNTKIPIKGIPRSRDKISRAYDIVPQIAVGNVHIPMFAEWVMAYKAEFKDFTPQGGGDNDDQIDPTMDAIEDMLMDSDEQITGGQFDVPMAFNKDYNDYG